MTGHRSGTAVVCGATGRQGGAVTRALLARGWSVRALTRRPAAPAARALADIGAEVVAADMENPQSLRTAFQGASGVYSVQNGMACGFDREVLQGCNVVEAAAAVGINHLVYGSAGTGAHTGIPSWESKLAIEDRIRSLGVPSTILRPMAFMELMTDKAFYPAFGTWHIWPKLMGDDRPIPWLAVADLGAIAAVALDQPEQFVGRELLLTADVQSLAQCRSIFREVTGREPSSRPMPIWLFDRFTRKDTAAMWRWARTAELNLDTTSTRTILPSALTVRQWLAQAGSTNRSEPKEE